MATTQLVQTPWRTFSKIPRQRSYLSGLANSQKSTANPVLPVSGGLPIAIADVNREQSSDKSLFHRTLVAELRQDGKRAVKRVRKRGWYVMPALAPFSRPTGQCARHLRTSQN